MLAYLSDRAALDEAVELLQMFGEHAELEARARADHSRSLGNLIRFCHWRQISRAIVMLSEEEASGTIH